MAGRLTDVLPSIAALLGVDGAPDRLALTEPLDGVDRVLLVLVDGLGWHLLPRLAPHAPLLAGVLAGEVGDRRELACTFPSTTPTSLVSLGTGAGPGEHGILGFTLDVPGQDRLLTHITWRGDPPPEQWQPVPTWFARMAAAGVATRAVLPTAFLDSGLTVAAYGGAEFHGLADERDQAGALLDTLRAGPGLVYGYTPILDHAAHVHGIASEQWQQAAAAVDRLLQGLLAGLPAGAALVVTADHGGLDVPADNRLDVATDPRLAEGLRTVAGEPRVRYLHTRMGAAADVQASWQAVLGDRFDVRSREEAIAAGLFGPVRPEHRLRIGDVVAIAQQDWAVIASGYEPPELARLVGFHGARTAAETAIPLITLRPADRD